MNVIILNGAQADDQTGEQVRAALLEALHTRGWQVEEFVLREQKIGACAGDFFCWIRNPGVCNVNDDNRLIAEAMVDKDVIIYLTPITFGGYNSTLKRMVDHQIQNISPNFATINGETHHHKRYSSYPDFLSIGWLEAADAPAEQVFHYLAQRNGLNFHANKVISGVVLAGHSVSQLQSAVEGWLDDLMDGRPLKMQGLLPAPEQIITVDPAAALETMDIRRALLLVGSPKTRKSTSNALGEYLFEQLQTQSITTETIYLHTVVRSPKKMAALLEAVEAADLIVLAHPLYVDSLPAPVIEVLELIAAQRQNQEQPRRQLFAAIANCGFPEAHHNVPALAMCALFAHQAGFIWAGSLALGGGQGIVNGISLSELDGRVNHIKAALDLAAAALAQGRAIPAEAQNLVARPVIPAWLYRLMGGFGWRMQARQYGAQKQLKRRPYAEQR
ncbi:MAG: NAD(P)H-dependent oxidoreductase [Anaerolineales bacterium]